MLKILGVPAVAKNREHIETYLYAYGLAETKMQRGDREGRE
jgi:hypothetical protein